MLTPFQPRDEIELHRQPEVPTRRVEHDHGDVEGKHHRNNEACQPERAPGALRLLHLCALGTGCGMARNVLAVNGGPRLVLALANVSDGLADRAEDGVENARNYGPDHVAHPKRLASAY